MPSSVSHSSSRHLKSALDLAEDCLRLGNPPFGAQLVRRDDVLAVGSNVAISSGNPLRHAEIEALFNYFSTYNDLRVRRRGHVEEDLVMFCSTEPCLMCMGAIHWAGVRRVVFAGSQAELCLIRGYGSYLTRDDALQRSFRRSKL